MELFSTNKDIFDVLTFALGAWGAILSTRLAYAKQRSKLVLRTDVKSPFDQLELQIFNASQRRISVRNGQLRYGLSVRSSQTILEIQALEKLVLDAGDGASGKVAIADLRKAVLEQKVPQRRYSRIWLVAKAFNDRSYSTAVRVDPAIINQPYDAQAEPYIATDVVMGFSHLFRYLPHNWSVKSR